MASLPASITANACSRFTEGNPVQEIFDGFSALQGVDKVLQGHARADKDRRAAKYLRVGMDDALEVFGFHGNDNTRLFTSSFPVESIEPTVIRPPTRPACQIRRWALGFGALPSIFRQFCYALR